MNICISSRSGCPQKSREAVKHMISDVSVGNPFIKYIDFNKKTIKV